MKAWPIALALFVCPLASSRTYFVTGTDLHDWWIAMKRVENQGSGKADWPDLADQNRLIAYVEGVFDTHDVLQNCIPKAVAGQLATVVGNYLDKHPENWQAPGSIIVMAALDESFHCVNWSKQKSEAR